jgi:heptosyltransferase-3
METLKQYEKSGKSMKVPRKILVVIPLRIGDVLLSTPVIRSMRQAWPDAEIDVLVFENTEGVLLRNPDIRRVITVPARPGFREHLSLILGLLRRYDLALTTQLGDRPTLYTWIAGKIRIGMQDGSSKEHWKQHLLTHWAFFDRVNTHTVLTNLGLVDLLGIKRNHEVVVAWDTSDEKSVTGLLPFDIGLQPYAVLHMSPKFSYKMWHRDGWIQLARRLEANGIRVVLTGSGAPDEMEYVGQIFRSMPTSTVNMAGKLSLAESAFLISRAKCYVGPDTALTHVAAALGTPTVALFGPSNPVKWGPWPKGYDKDINPYQMRGTQHVSNVVLLQGEGDCVPCMEEGCDRRITSLSACLQGLPVEKVIAALGELGLPLVNEPLTGFLADSEKNAADK